MPSPKYSKELLEAAVSASQSYAGVLRYLGLRQAGGTQHHIANRIKAEGIDTTHFRGQAWLKGGHPTNKKSAELLLVLKPENSTKTKTDQLRRALREVGVDEQCECGLRSEWNGKKLQLEIDHINGQWWDNRVENLRWICPNCHSQCETTNKPNKYKPA